MNVSGFAALADIIGRRIRVAWDFVPAAGETVADIPPVTLRRKQRDYAFGQPLPDASLVYDTGRFPPAPVPGVMSVTDLDGWEKIWNGERHVFEPISVAVASGGRFVEILRRTTVTVFDLNGVPLRQGVEILDVGQLPGALQANQVYYYQLFGSGLPTSGDAAAPYRSSAMVTDSYGQNRALYYSLPEIYRRHDVVKRRQAPGMDSVPELSPGHGQLRRFLDPFGIAIDSLRGTAEGLRTLHDVDNIDARYLPQIAQWIGWDLSIGVEIPLTRNEIKTASRLYQLVGTLPGLRALVTQYAGWSTQIAEFAQNIARSNQPPRRNLFAIAIGADGNTWRGVDDAAEILGFAGSNQPAAGTSATAATLTGTAGQPFSLRPGMTLTIAVDRLLPSSLRFGPDDFADISQATAAEVAAAINGALSEVHAQAHGGLLTLASQTVGVDSLIEIVPAPTSLVSLENAPTGRLSAAADSAGRLRLFYEVWETPTQPAPGSVASSGPTAAETGNYVLRRIHYKTFIDGAWRDSQPIFTDRLTPQADPAVVVLPDGRLWLAWLDDPSTPTARLRFSLGRSRVAQPARMLGQKREPFALTDGGVLTLIGNWPGVDHYTVHKANFADINKCSAAELVAAMNGQLTHAIATREQNGSIGLANVGGGALARVAIDLAQSTTARVLGFDSRNATGAAGTWSDLVDWSAPGDAVSIPPGRHAEVVALNDPTGGIRLAWASHRAGRWRIDTVHWNDRILVGTANGAFLRSGLGAWAPVSGLPSADIRAIAVDANGTAWIATAAGVALRHPDGTIAALTPALPSADVRDLVLGSDGTVVFATAKGIAIRAGNGTISSVTIGSQAGLVDIRALALSPDGTLWAATAAGAAKGSLSGPFQVFDTTAGLPANAVQGIAVDAGGTVYIATNSGLAISAAGGGFTIVGSKSGLSASDARAVAVAVDGTVWVATATGVSKRSPAGVWTVVDIAAGLNSADTRSLAFAPDGSVWVGTAVGVSIIAADGSVNNPDLLGGGLVNPAGRAVHTGWSMPQELVGGAGGYREPTMAVDGNKRIWLVWSERIAIGDTGEGWGLYYRIYDPATSSWGAINVLTPQAGVQAADRMPSVQPLPAGMRMFFASDRKGGFGLWSVDVTLAGAVGPLVGPLVDLPDHVSSDQAPTPIAVGNAIWLLYRGDANVALAQVGSSPRSDGLQGSVRVPDNGTVRRYAGTVAADLNDLDRLRTRGAFGDLFCYTPNRPDGVGTLADGELYTRGTVGLYVSSASHAAEVTQQEAERLHELLARFIPINLRALIILVNSAEEELVYANDAGIQDSYSDDFPFVSILGALGDSTAAAMPAVSVLVANKVDNVSANPADLTTLRRRTFFLPLQ